jgi:hypothetical protein
MPGASDPPASGAKPPADPPAPAQDGGSAAAAEDEPPGGDTWLLGVMGQRGAASCPSGMSRTWLNVVPTIGSVRALGVADDAAEALMGEPVIAFGRPRPLGTAMPEVEVHPCPPMQMREDWVETPQGIRIRREPQPDFDAFAVSTVRRIEEITATLEGDRVIVELGNPLPVRMEHIRLTLHYEGCFGKPGSHASTPKVAAVDPGASRRTAWPAFYEDGGRSYAARSVQLSAQAAGAVFDLDIPLRVIGAVVDCPDRGKKTGLTGTSTTGR